MRPFDRRTTSDTEATTLASLVPLRTASEARIRESLDVVVPLLPLKIQVQTLTRCNAACMMCPYPEVAGEPGFAHRPMETSLYDALLAQLAGQPVERFSPFLMNEPLLDRHLEDRLRSARAALPNTTLGLFTNGSALTGARARSLAEAGLDELCVSVHGFDADTYGAVMVGLSFERVMANLREVVRLHAAGALGGLRLQIVTGDVPALTGAATPAPEWLAPYVLLKGFSNERLVSEVEPSATPTPERGPRPLCQRPFVKLYVLADGDCVMCNCDWRRRVVLGNLRERPLSEIWRGAAYAELRTRHVRLDFPEGHPCRGCDYPWVVDE
jgi:radical SAM protein with 4Fe4S-binding SPASM domain